MLACGATATRLHQRFRIHLSLRNRTHPSAHADDGGHGNQLGRPGRETPAELDPDVPAGSGFVGGDPRVDPKWFLVRPRDQDEMRRDMKDQK